MRWTHALTAMALAGVISAGAAAQPGPGWHHLEGMEVLHGLSLTGAQQGQVHAIIKHAWEQAKPLRKKMRALHEQMADQLLAEGSASAEQLAPLVQQSEQLRGQLDQIHVDTMVKIRALLTPEQVTRAADLHKKLSQLHEQERQLVDGDEE